MRAKNAEQYVEKMRRRAATKRAAKPPNPMQVDHVQFVSTGVKCPRIQSRRPFSRYVPLIRIILPRQYRGEQ